MSRTYSDITWQVDGAVGTLTFNRPERLNAMGRRMMDEIITCLEDSARDSSVRVLVLTGAGKAFMAGADIKEYAAASDEEFRAFQQRGAALYAALERHPCPCIAAVRGYALGGGFEIALACDLVYASESARFGLPEIKLALVPGGGGTQRLPRKIGINRSKELLMSGRAASAAEMHEWGVVNTVFSDEEYDSGVRELAAKLADREPAALAKLKELVGRAAPPPEAEALAAEQAALLELAQSDEARRRIREFAEGS